MYTCFIISHIYVYVILVHHVSVPVQYTHTFLLLTLTTHSQTGCNWDICVFAFTHDIDMSSETSKIHIYCRKMIMLNLSHFPTSINLAYHSSYTPLPYKAMHIDMRDKQKYDVRGGINIPISCIFTLKLFMYVQLFILCVHTKIFWKIVIGQIAPLFCIII